MLNKLREATNELHKQIEQGNLAGDIMSRTITLENYKILLLQNYVAYKIVDTEISKFIVDFNSDKAERIEKDLKSLGVNTEVYKEFESDFKIANFAEAWGAWYVVEGSVLGGMMISKEISNCNNLAEIEEHHFFNGNRQSVNGWKIYCSALKTIEFSEEEEAAALEKAKETFQFFGHIFTSLNPEMAVNS